MLAPLSDRQRSRAALAVAVAWALGIVLAVMTLGYMLYPGPLDKDTRLPDNPLGIASLKSVFDHSDRAAAVSMVGLRRWPRSCR